MTAQYETVVVGGGAAGICAAISSARAGNAVVICEKMPQLGKKILATGNGRCNLLNDSLSERYYNSASRFLVKSVFARFGKAEILRFFKDLGLEVYSSEGRIFPVTNQASSVLRVMELELQRLRIPAEYSFECSHFDFSSGLIDAVAKDGRRLRCVRAVLTGGGKTYPALGSDGSAFEIAGKMGHSLVAPVPSAVPLVVKDPLCFLLQGQKIRVNAWSMIAGQKSGVIDGELLFTRYGLSGTAVLDLSEEISVALNRNSQKKVVLSVDMVPFLSPDNLAAELENRKSRGWLPADMLAGILPNKFCLALQNLFLQKDIRQVAAALKDRRFAVTATRGWNEAEFTAGGIDAAEVKPGTLESRLKPGVFFAGEVLDVNGKRGGYNLAWAWASGYVAGQGA